MTKQNIRHAGVVFHRPLQKGVGILHRGKPAAMEITKCSLFTSGFAVAHMVLGNHHNPLAIEPLGKILIALYVLGNVMHQLHDGPRMALGFPNTSSDLARSGGAKIILCTHSITRSLHIRRL